MGSTEIVEVGLSKLRELRSTRIESLFVQLKMSRNRSDKVALIEVRDALKMRRNEETKINTKRVTAFPRVMTVFGYTSHVSLRFRDVRLVTSMGYLRMFINGMANPENELEAEALDLVSERMKKLQTLKEASKETGKRKSKQSESSKSKKKRK